MGAGVTTRFPGFPRETVAFLRDLAAHNDRAWFDAHKGDYQRWWLEVGKAFVIAVEPGLQKLCPGLRAQPKVNGSLFRLNRDTRFSADKRPYKVHLDVWLWEGPVRRQAASGFFFRLKPTYWALGAGAHAFDKDQLARYREAVVDPKAGKRLLAAVDAVEAAGYPVQGEKLKKLPRGFTATGRAADLLRHDGLWVARERPLDDVVFGPGIVEQALAGWREMVPLHRWLVGELQRG